MKLKEEMENDKKIKKRKSLSKETVSIRKFKNIENENNNKPIKSEYFLSSGIKNDVE